MTSRFALSLSRSAGALRSRRLKNSSDKLLTAQIRPQGWPEREHFWLMIFAWNSSYILHI